MKPESPEKIADKIALTDFAIAWPFIQRELVDPREEFLQRPSKKFRGEMVNLAFEMAHPLGKSAQEEFRCEKAAALLESLHAGSLVVDDIQDDSRYRRGKATLHRLYGVARAINVGNWLYFDALDSIAEWNLPAERECQIWRLCHRALNRAHIGQGIDLGVAIDKVNRQDVTALCLSSLELKTGALMELAFGLGGVLSGTTVTSIEQFQQFGREFGVALQMLDDLGNLEEKKITDASVGSIPDGKQFEDLRLRRPSWVWATAATHLDDEGFLRFVGAVHELPDTQNLLPLLAWLLPLGQQGANSRLNLALERLADSKLVTTERGTKALVQLGEQVARLKGAYFGKPN